MANENDWEEIPTETDDSDWEDVSSNSANLDPVEALKTLAGGATGFAAGKAVSPIVEKGAAAVAEKALDPAAELLAYRAAGGYSGTEAGKALNKKTLLDNAGKSLADNLKDLAETGAYDSGVTPRSVGREILDNDILGKLGIFTTKGGNLQRASQNLDVKGVPKAAILEQISEYPIQKEGILNRTKEILGADKLNPTVPDEALIQKKLGKQEPLFSGTETPAQAERAKVTLQRKADFADPDKTVKNAMSTAQSTARKEAVENAVLNALGPEKLEEFKQLKAKAGSAGVAKDMLEELYDKSQKPFSQFNGIIGAGIDYAKQRGAGVAANTLDAVSGGLKTGAKAIAPGIGTLLGLTAGAAAADEQTDAADFIPGLDQASAAGNPLDDKLIRAESKAYNLYENSPARKAKVEALKNQTQKMEQDLSNLDPSFQSGFAYKKAQDEITKNKVEIERLSKSSNRVVSGGKELNKASPDQLMELSQTFANVKGADKFVAPLENAAQADTEEERQARLFGLYQQPAFRQLLKREKKIEE